MSIQTAASPPKGWKWVTLADVAKVVTGNTPPTADAQNYGDAIPFVKPTELVDRGIRFAPAGLADQALGKARIVPAGAVLVSCIGNLGKTGLAKVPVAFNQQINAVVFNENVVPEFGFYYAQTLKSWLYGESSATTLPIINKGKFQQAPFPLAPLAEQREIVAELEKQFSRLDEAVANLKRVKANLKRYKASVLKDAVEGRLVPTEAELARREGRSFETGEQLLQRILEARRTKLAGRGKHREPLAYEFQGLPQHPEGWTWCSVDAVAAETLIGLDRGRDQQRVDAIGSPYVKMNNVTMDGRVLTDDLVFVDASKEELARYSLICGDLLFNTRNSLELVGKVGLVETVPTGTVFNNNLMRLRVVDGVSPMFLCCQMCEMGFRRRMEKVKKATTSVAAVYQKDFLPLAIAIPPLAEQIRIVAEVDRCLSLVRGVEVEVDANLKRAQALRQSCLASAFMPTKAKVIVP